MIFYMIRHDQAITKTDKKKKKNQHPSLVY